MIIMFIIKKVICKCKINLNRLQLYYVCIENPGLEKVLGFKQL